MRPHRLIVLLAAAAACGDSARTASAVLDEVAPATAYDALPVVTLQPEALLCPATPEQCLLPSRGFGAVSPRGDAVVGVGGPRRAQLLLVPADGSGARLIGREGDGPGEYRLPAFITFAPDGDIAVVDLMSRRQLRWSPAGEARGTGQLQLAPAPLRAATPGGWVGERVRMLSAADGSAQGDSLPIYVFELEPGGTARRLHALDLKLPAHGLTAMFAPAPLFAPSVHFAMRPDGGVALTTGERLVVLDFASDGTLRRRVGFDIRGRAVTPQDIEARRATMLGGPVSPQMRAALERSLAQVADRHAAVTQVVDAPDALWLRRTPDEAGGSVEWLELDAALAPTRRLRLAPRDHLIGRQGGRYLVAREGDDEASTGYWWMRAPRLHCGPLPEWRTCARPPFRHEDP